MRAAASACLLSLWVWPGDEQHLVFECAALQPLRRQWLHLFEGCATMQQCMWQADLAGVAGFISRSLAAFAARGLSVWLWVDQFVGI